MERPTTISPFHPFPDRCGWNQAIEWDGERDIIRTVKSASDSLSF